MKFLKPFHLELAVISIPVLVALSQVCLHLTSNLSAWKGGGYGMYTDPPPNKHHRLWLVDYESETQLLIGRKAQSIDTIADRKLRKAISDLYWDSKPFLYFPDYYNLERVQEPIRKISKNHSNAGHPFQFLSSPSLTFLVTETQISPAYDSLRLVPLFAVPLNQLP